jgi:regulator of RNase E activity RraA
MIARTRLLTISRAMSTSTPSSTCPLLQFSACEISDALIKLGSPNGGHIPDVYMLSPTSQVKICAPAYTVQMVLASDKSAPKLSSHFVDTATPGSIVVIDAPPRSVCSTPPYYVRPFILMSIAQKQRMQFGVV